MKQRLVAGLLVALLGCPRPVSPPPPPVAVDMFPLTPGIVVYLIEESRPGDSARKRPWTMEIGEARDVDDARLVRVTGFVLDLCDGADPARRQTILAVRASGVSLGLETPATLAALHGPAPDPGHLAPELVLPLVAGPMCTREPCFSVEPAVEVDGARAVLVHREDGRGRTTLTLVEGVGVARFVHHAADGREVRGELVDRRPPPP